MTGGAVVPGAVAFADALRGAGLAVPPDSSITFVEALALVGLDDPAGWYWAGRATLVHRPEDIETYDRVFASFFTGRGTPLVPRVEQRVTIAVDDPDADEGPDDDGAAADRRPDVTLRFSRHEVLGDKDFADYTDAELAEAQALMARLRFGGAMRSSRRAVPTRRPGGRPDLRRTVRASLRSGGEPVRRRFTERGERPRRVVLLLDVSGSMEPYARALLRFVHAAVVARGRIEAFALGTRLTRMTRELSTRNPDEALRRAADSVVDYAGGTRLGDALGRFNDEWGVRGMARGAIVVVLSDGWDRGEPEVLAEQMQRLARVTHRLVWVNPLKASPGYEPLARGMAAALPHVDTFIEGHSLNALVDLAAVIADDRS